MIALQNNIKNVILFVNRQRHYKYEALKATTSKWVRIWIDWTNNAMFLK